MTTPAEDVAAAAELLEPQARTAAAGGAPVPIPPAAALELVRWLRAEAQRLTRAALPEWQEVVSPHAAALARAVAAAPRTVEQPAVPRLLTDEEEEAAYQALRGELGPYAARVGQLVLTDALTAALAALRIFTPAPEPEPDTCPAQFVDLEGGWHQCVEDRGHAPALGHTDGEWAWPDGYTYATPES